MFEWKVEDMALMNAPSYMVGRERIFAVESSTSREDKIAFVDSMTDGRLSYLLDLISKFEAEKDSLPKDQFGVVKTNSLKAWMKKNDTKYEERILDKWWQYGSYNFLNVRRNIKTNRKGPYEHYDDLVDECFHRQLFNLVEKERNYFREHDEYEILKKKVNDYTDTYRMTFGADLSFCSNGRIKVLGENNKERDITKEELLCLIENYEKLDAFVQQLSESTHISYEEPNRKEAPIEKSSEEEEIER